MICSSTRSWISSTDGAWLITLHLFSTLVAISRIWAAVSLSASRISLLPLVMAAMILVISKSTSQPLRLIIFIGGSLLLVLLSHVCKKCIGANNFVLLHATLCGFHDNKILWFGQGAEPQFMPFQALQEQTKIFRIFCILLQIGTIFRISCAFHALFPVFRTAFSAHSLLDLPRSTKHNILWFAFAPTAMLFSSGTPARHSSPQVEISLEKSVFFRLFSTFKALQSIFIICVDTAAHRRGPTALHRHAAAWFLIQKEASP